MDAPELWKRYRQYLCRVDSLDFTLDISRMHFNDSFLASMELAMQHAFADMNALEGGAIANPDEKRMVGHYWLRAPELAPNKEIAREIKTPWNSSRNSPRAFTREKSSRRRPRDSPKSWLSAL